MEKFLLEDYIANNMSQRDIAERCNISQSTVKYWLKKHKLSTKVPWKLRKNAPLCRVCGETNPSKFYGNKKSTCGSCHNKLTIQKSKNNKIKGIEYLGGKCSTCGYDKCVAALEFHHKDPKIKDKNFSSATNWSWERLKKELDKCVLVCANCHREIHYHLDKE